LITWARSRLLCCVARMLLCHHLAHLRREKARLVLPASLLPNTRQPKRNRRNHPSLLHPVTDVRNHPQKPRSLPRRPPSLHQPNLHQPKPQQPKRAQLVVYSASLTAPQTNQTTTASIPNPTGTTGTSALPSPPPARYATSTSPPKNPCLWCPNKPLEPNTSNIKSKPARELNTCICVHVLNIWTA
jgi:hypothetical protein